MVQRHSPERSIGTGGASTFFIDPPACQGDRDYNPRAPAARSRGRGRMSEQFWVTGADGKEYGPVPLETLTRWIREGRIVATSTVRTETSPKSEARLRPELAAFFASVAAPPPGAGGQGTAPPT